MGGEDKEKSITDSSGQHDQVEDVFDTSMSRLLQDFNSAELLPNHAPDGINGASSVPDSDCDNVATSMKHLHLRSHGVTKQKDRIPASTKKNTTSSLNLAVAACGFQRPIVWPARLSSNSGKDNSHFLRPSRLTVNTKCTSNKDTKCNRSPSSVENKSQKENSKIFGSISDSSDLSFSSLCEQDCLKNKNEDVQNGTCRSRSSNHPTAGPIKTSCKRQYTSDAPPSKVARTFAEDDTCETNQTIFHDYRLPGPSSDCNDSLAHKLPVADRITRNTTNITQCTNHIAATSPSSLETLEPLRSALTTYGQSASQCLTDDLSLTGRQEPDMDDTNMNELASYLEDLLHIPRKMSSMAEMMYA